MRVEKKQKLAVRRRWRVRQKVTGTAERPRMAVCFTGQNIYVQFIDDTKGATLAAVSTLGKSVPDRENLAANVKSATIIGKLAAQAALDKGIKVVVFDRGGARYHWTKGGKGKDAKPPVYGKVAALAVAAREAGLKF